MNGRATLVVLILALLGVGYWIFDTNREVMSQPLALWTLPGQAAPIRLPVGQAFIFSMAFGAVAIAFFWALRSTQAVVSALMERRSSKEDRQTEALYQRGLETLLNGRPERALAAMRSVLERDPDHAGALMTGADILRTLGRPADAAE